jgi:hypothetical protein
MTAQFRVEFESISSEEDLGAFAGKYNLARSSAGGANATYVGSVAGQAVELREHWWDPSSVYAVKRDQHEVVLLVGGISTARVRFTGGS